jgi:hypothetical protein
MEHKEQMALMLETMSCLRKTDENSIRQTRAKKVEMPRLGALREVQIGQFLAWEESFETKDAMVPRRGTRERRKTDFYRP